jgi:RHS repeat-associated protein
MTFAGEEPLLGTLKLTAEVDSAKKEEKDFTNLTYTRTSEEAYKGSNSVILAREKGMISSQAMKVQKGGSFTYQLAYKAYEISTLSMVEDLDNGKKSSLLATIPLFSVGEIMTPNTENKAKLLNFNVLGLLPLAKKIFTKPTKSFRIGKFSEKPQASISFRIYSDSTLSAVVWEKTVSLQEATQWQTAKDSLEIPENGYLVSVLKNENNKETLLDEFELRTYGTQKARIIQENHYEPFGMTLQGLDYVAEDTRGNKFLYNGGVERQEELGLYWDDSHARGYNMQNGRFEQIDPLSEKYTGVSGYNFSFNNPVNLNDPSGLEPENFCLWLCPTFRFAKVNNCCENTIFATIKYTQSRQPTVRTSFL